jgi:hypothetical protein
MGKEATGSADDPAGGGESRTDVATLPWEMPGPLSSRRSRPERAGLRRWATPGAVEPPDGDSIRFVR